MHTQELRYPVFTLERKELLGAGRKLSKDTLAGVLDAGEPTAYPAFSVLEHGSIRMDLLRFFRAQPYHVIFRDES